MATQIWAINFAQKYELHQYSGDNNEPVFIKSAPVSLHNLTWFHVTFL